MPPESPVIAPLVQRQVWGDDDARFYLQGLQQSDYAARLGGLLGAVLADTGSLLDVGAGAGTLPAAFLKDDAQWTAIEPNDYLATELERLGALRPVPPRVIRSVWQELGELQLGQHESVLAANMCGPLDDPVAFWERLAPFCTRTMVWTVPAQRGPRKACLSGALPASLHGEDETPAVELVLAALPASMQPDEVRYADWTFSFEFPDPEAAFAYFDHKFNPQGDAARAGALRAHLQRTLQPTFRGVTARSPRKGACLVWHF